jgi:AcrR family transcriptional regulator
LGAVKRTGTRAEQSEATRARLLAAAAELFAARGYAAVGTEEIVRRAQVTRGALYHHFEDKRDLFRAVHEGLEQASVAAIARDMDAAGIADPFQLLVAGVRSFLDACTDPSFAQIALLDAPTVLGWAQWREIDARYGLGLVTVGLQRAMDAGSIQPQDVRPLAHVVLGALGEAAMVIAHAADPKAERRAVEPALLSLLQGLRAVGEEE